MFTKILIANRGEIAVRIIATCREMGIRTVAIYSAVDRHARHVLEADEAYLIGPAPASQSYLQIETIIKVAHECHAEAIHPGYGFLSENALFAEACTQADLVFIGPPASVIRVMGSKIAARKIAQSVKTPTVPGYDGADQNPENLLQEARRIGFPLLIKASAGGGGKGMREVQHADDFLAELAGARRETLAAFGDDTIFLERLIQQPRHIEIQILADAHGHTIHLGERECSIQRRHQKIVEESPSPALTPALREQITSSAVRIAQAAGYINAGTLEFMLDSDNQFYFLEMNTRLQVEHPVTEIVTGLDIVRQQILIAAGEPLPYTQEQISQRGHAIEVRIYAEDANQNFLPSTGSITCFVQPTGPGIRLDSSLSSQGEITQYYDPMIAKLIVSAEDRQGAIARLQSALTQTAIFGVTTNLPLLYSISQQTAFITGAIHTHFLTEQNLLTPDLKHHLPDDVLIAAALYDLQLHPALKSWLPAQAVQHNPWQTLGPWRLAGEERQRTYIYQDKNKKITLTPIINSLMRWQVQIGSQAPEEITAITGIDPLFILQRGMQQIRTYIQHNNHETQVAYNGQFYRLQRPQPPSLTIDPNDLGRSNISNLFKAPMTGTLIKVQVHVGDRVEVNQVLMILSAMKMEHAITAPQAGRVKRVLYQERDVVTGGAVLIEME